MAPLPAAPKVVAPEPKPKPKKDVSDSDEESDESMDERQGKSQQDLWERYKKINK